MSGIRQARGPTSAVFRGDLGEAGAVATWRGVCLMSCVRIAVDTLELSVTDGLAEAIGHVVAERVSSPLFASVRDLRLRFRNVQGALLCIAAVGLTGGGLATSTATGTDPIQAAVGALDALPGRIERVRPPARDASVAAVHEHASVRAQMKKLLDHA